MAPVAPTETRAISAEQMPPADAEARIAKVFHTLPCQPVYLSNAGKELMLVLRIGHLAANLQYERISDKMLCSFCTFSTISDEFA